MKKNKLELLDEASYNLAIKQWLESSNNAFDLKNEDQMNEYWLKFADDLGILLGSKVKNESLTSESVLVEVVDPECWKEARKYYSIISFKTEQEATV